MSKKLPQYRCNGICESCEKGKWFEKGQYYSCDPKKTKGIIVICPTSTMRQLKQ